MLVNRKIKEMQATEKKFNWTFNILFYPEILCICPKEPAVPISFYLFISIIPISNLWASPARQKVTISLRSTFYMSSKNEHPV